jgi:hypothetical protein
MMWLFFFWLITKHFILDFLWQPSYEFLNKGTLFHWGGIRHALKHGLATFIIIGFWDIYLGLFLAICEMTLHYIIDYLKMNINRIQGWRCNEDIHFWWLLRFDQYLHYLCYLGIVWVVHG